MPRTISTGEQPARFHRPAMLWLYPQLRALPPETWQSMLDKARNTDFHPGEWICMVGGVAFVTWLLSSDAAVYSTTSAILLHVIRFFIALPLLALIVGPIYLRRTRRGLDRELTRKPAHPQVTAGSDQAKEARNE